MERDLLTIQCYKCWEVGHYSKECPILPTLATRENAGFSTWRFSVEEKGKAQVHLIELMSEGREKVLMGLEKNLKIPEDAIDVMAQTKRPVEGTSHPDTNVKRFKEMRGPQKRKKETAGGGLDSKTFQFLEILVFIRWGRMWDLRKRTSPLDSWWQWCRQLEGS
jgi:hypothetical protein